MLAFAEHESRVGPCGFNHDETTDEDEFFAEIVEKKPCPVCEAADRHNRVLAKHDGDWVKQHSKGDEGPAADQPWPSDGRVTFIRRVPKDEAMERMERARQKQQARGSTARPARPRPAPSAADS